MQRRAFVPMAAFKAESDAALVAPLIADIDAFLATGDDGLDDRFRGHFRPDVMPTSFRPNTRKFLEAIRDALMAGRDGVDRAGADR